MITPNDDIRFPDTYIFNLNKFTKSFWKKNDITDMYSIKLEEECFNGVELSENHLQRLEELVKDVDQQSLKVSLLTFGKVVKTCF